MSYGSVAAAAAMSDKRATVRDIPKAHTVTGLRYEANC